MSASEFAFLALGLVIGVASGAAFLATFRSRPPAREIRVTMTRDAIPRRSETLSTDAFSPTSAKPARGGPADSGPLEVAAAVAAVAALAAERREVPAWPPEDVLVRTLVLGGVTHIGLPIGPSGSSDGADDAVGSDGLPSRDALPAAVARWARGITPPASATALVAERVAAANAAAGPAPMVSFPSARLEILRGDRSVLVAVADAAAAHDRRAAEAWEARLDLLVAGLTARALDLGVLDFPLGHPFWDDFTIEECRRLAATLSAAGHRFDGGSRWSGGRAPTHAELSAAVAACGIQPTRVRAWPTRIEIADLYRGARIAWSDLLAVAPALDPDGLRVLLADRAAGLDAMWLVWDDARSHLLAEARASIR